MTTDLKLRSGDRVAVIGGGPAGSFFSCFFLQMAGRLGLDVELDLFEPRTFGCSGPQGCNMCGGIVSESLLQNLAAEGIRLPETVIQRRIDSYSLHMDAGSVRIETPLKEMRIAAVHRGGGPRGVDPVAGGSLDSSLLEMARSRGARVVPSKVTGVSIGADGRPVVAVKGKDAPRPYDLAVAAVGVNSTALKLFEGSLPTYRRPRTTKAYVCEFYLGASMIEAYLGNSMHVFLMDLPRLDFAALIPKKNHVTVCLLGRDIDTNLVDSFLSSPMVRACMPPHWRPPDQFCHCSPKMSIGPAVKPFADRMLFVGDCGTTRLYKDGIGAAYRSAKAAARAVVFHGISSADLEKHYGPTCRAIHNDNRIGKLVFGVTKIIQKSRIAQTGVWRMVSGEKRSKSPPRMSSVLWDTFTGSAPYTSVLKRSLHPGFLGGLFRESARGLLFPRRGGRMRMATGATGAMGRKYRDGEPIYQQGEAGECMYVIQGGQVELIRRAGDSEFCLAVLEDGDFFGEMALFGEETRPATARAQGEAVVYTLEKASLLRRIHEDPSLAFRLIQKMCERVRDLEASLVRMASVPGD